MLTLKTTEYAECVTLWDWMIIKGLATYSFHIPNESKRSKYAGGRLKRIGMRAGVSDYFIAIPRGSYHGLWLEIKVGKNKLTQQQEFFFFDMQMQHYCCRVAYGFDEAKAYIESYLAL